MNRPWSELLPQLLEEGYQSFFVQIDAEIAEKYPCIVCGRPTRYAGMIKLLAPHGLNVYHAYSICDHCDLAFEF